MNKATRFRQEVMRRLEETGMKPAELARRSGVTAGAIYKLLQREGATTGAENARAIADVLEIEGDFGPPAPVALQDGAALVPIYDVQASAGPGLIPLDYIPITGLLAFALDYLRNVLHVDPAHAGLITVNGDSMTETLKDKDLILLDLAAENFDKAGIYAFRHDGGVLIKRVMRSARAGFIWAIPDNARYHREEYPVNEVSIIGRMVWSGGAA